ncbi:MAG: hypothetical protein U0835_04625 [Isosphaeraceae bacterium]
MSTDRTLIQIRERSLIDLLDLTLVVVRGRPKELVLAALAGAAPFCALNMFLTSNPEFSFPAFVYLIVLEAPWATAPLTVVLGSLMFGGKATFRQVVVSLFRALPALFVYQFLVRGLLLVTFVLYLMVPTRLAFLDEVILLERGRFTGVVKRCSSLCGARGGDLFGQWMAQLFFGFLFVVCFWFGSGALISGLTSSEMTWDRPAWADLYGFRFQAGLWIAIQFFGVTRFLTYIDQRIRIEGWEVKLRLQSVGRSLEEAGRW